MMGGDLTNGRAGYVAHAYNPSAWGADTEGSQVQGQPGIRSETLFQTQS